MRLERHPHGPRLYVFGLRLHHGLTGCIFVAAGIVTRQPRLIQIGLVLIADDIQDAPWPLRDRPGLTTVA